MPKIKKIYKEIVMYWFKSIFIITLVTFVLIVGCNENQKKTVMQLKESIAWGQVSNGLQIGLSTKVSKYKQGEPILLSFHVKNVSKKSLWLLRVMDNPNKPHMDIEIQDINGKVIYKSHAFQSYVDELLELTPGSECEEILIPTSTEMLEEINKIIKGKGYIRGMSDDDAIALSRLLPGTYKAVGFHYFELFKGLSTEIKNKVWTGKVKSKTVLFEVIK